MAQISVLGGEARFHCVSLLCQQSTALLLVPPEAREAPCRNGLLEFLAINISSISSAHSLKVDV